ncbi:MAG: cupin domain-containing protein [Gaiellales bacterium]
MAAAPSSRIVHLGARGAEPIAVDGARGVTGLPLLDLSEGTGGFDFRAVAIAPGGVSADHSHPWEQANYVLRGRGRVWLGEDVHEVGPDDFVYVAPDVRHVFENAGDEELVLLAARGARA